VTARSRALALLFPLLLVILCGSAPLDAEMRAAPIFMGRGPSWPSACSDGHRLAFMMNANRAAEIFVFDLADTTKPPVAVTDSPKWDGKPSWSPDCDRIAFMSGRSGNEDIWVYSFATGACTQMTFSYEGNGIRAQEWGPAWSPDGSRIAFSSDRSGDDDIWWVPDTGGEPVRLTHRTLPRARDQDRYPAWSPDGRRIAFASQTTGNWDLWVAVVDDSTAKPVQLTADTTGEFSPAWSPNGRWIAFVSDRTGSFDLFAMPAAGGPAIQLTKNPGPDNTPCWSPDGKRIYYSGMRDEDVGLWVIEGLEEVLGPDYAARKK